MITGIASHFFSALELYCLIYDRVSNSILAFRVFRDRVQTLKVFKHKTRSRLIDSFLSQVGFGSSHAFLVVLFQFFQTTSTRLTVHDCVRVIRTYFLNFGGRVHLNVFLVFCSSSLFWLILHHNSFLPIDSFHTPR